MNGEPKDTTDKLANMVINLTNAVNSLTEAINLLIGKLDDIAQKR